MAIREELPEDLLPDQLVRELGVDTLKRMDGPAANEGAEATDGSAVVCDATTTGVRVELEGPLGDGSDVDAAIAEAATMNWAPTPLPEEDACELLAVRKEQEVQWSTDEGWQKFMHILRTSEEASRERREFAAERRGQEILEHSMWLGTEEGQVA